MNMRAQQQLAEHDLLAEQRRELVRFLTAKLGNPDDAQELAQDALIRIHRLRDSNHIENRRAYMYQVASNLATDKIRRKVLLNRYLEGESARLQDGEAQSADAPEEIVSARQQLTQMRKIIDGLPFKCRQALMLHRVRGLTYSEIAAELDVSVSSVEKYILEALRHFRANLP